eukprot:12325512-Karenia_brevis.AAC.1
MEHQRWPMQGVSLPTALGQNGFAQLRDAGLVTWHNSPGMEPHCQLWNMRCAMFTLGQNGFAQQMGAKAQVTGVLVWIGVGKLGNWLLGVKLAGGSNYSTGQEPHVPGDPMTRWG